MNAEVGCTVLAFVAGESSSRGFFHQPGLVCTRNRKARPSVQGSGADGAFVWFSLAEKEQPAECKGAVLHDAGVRPELAG